MTDTTTSAAASDVALDPLDGARIKADFPLLSTLRDKPLVYLDSAATSQKPRQVLDAMQTFYETTNANVARGVYAIAEEATNEMEAARRKVANFIGAPSDDEIVFVKNATEGLNLVAYSWGRANLRAGDAVVLTELEHHANIVPWQILAAELGFEIRWIPVGDDGLLDLTDLDRLLDGAKLLGLSAMSNVLGTLTPVRHLTDAAHAAGALVSLDACQYVPHNATNVLDLGADFASFSAHKMCGPTGIGVLWGRAELLDAMPPFLGGGGMIGNVTTEGFTTAAGPTSSRPAPRPSPRPSGSARRSTTSPTSAWTPCAPTRSRSRRTRCAPSPSASATAWSSTARPSPPCEVVSSPSHSATCTPTTSPRCSTDTTCASAPGITAPSP